MNADCWREAGGYPDPQSTSLARWAWEFLRRNPEYRADWHRYTDVCETLARDYGTQIAAERELTEVAWEREDPRGSVYEPERLEGETEGAWRARVGSGRCSPLGGWLCEKWGLHWQAPLDPAIGHFKCMWEITGSSVRFVKQQRNDSLLGGTYPAIEFNLTRPLEPQLAAAKRALLGRQRHLKNKGVLRQQGDSRAQAGATYRRYLRVLDAVEVGASHSEIGKVLFRTDAHAEGRRSKVRAHIRSAQELRDGGYRRLPTLSPRLRPGLIRPHR